jgi:hypothetical protein
MATAKTITVSTTRTATTNKPTKTEVVTPQAPTQATQKRTMNRISNVVKFKIMKEMETSYISMGLPDAGFARAMSAKFNVQVAAGTISALRKDLGLPLNKSVVTRDALDSLEKDLQLAQSKVTYLITRLNSTLPDEAQLTEEAVEDLMIEQAENTEETQEA